MLPKLIYGVDDGLYEYYGNRIVSFFENKGGGREHIESYRAIVLFVSRALSPLWGSGDAALGSKKPRSSN